MTVSRIVTTNAPAAVGPYSQGVSTGQEAGSLVFVSGQVPLDPATGSLVEGDIQAQAEQVLKNVGAILAEAGTRWSARAGCRTTTLRGTLLRGPGGKCG